MPRFNRGTLTPGTYTICSTYGAWPTGSPGHVAWVYLMSPSCPGRAFPPLATMFYRLWESSSFPETSDNPRSGAGGLGNASSIPSASSSCTLTRLLHWALSQPRSEIHEPSPSSRFHKVPAMSCILWALYPSLRIWGHRQGSRGRHSVCPSASLILTNFPHKLHFPCLYYADSTATAAPGSNWAHPTLSGSSENKEPSLSHVCPPFKAQGKRKEKKKSLLLSSSLSPSAARDKRAFRVMSKNWCIIG